MLLQKLKVDGKLFHLISFFLLVGFSSFAEELWGKWDVVLFVCIFLIPDLWLQQLYLFLQTLKETHILLVNK